MNAFLPATRPRLTREDALARLLRCLPVLLCLLCGVSCNTPTEITTRDGTKIRTSGRVGGQGGLYVRQGDTEIQTYDNNEDSFREVGKTARFGIGAAQLGSVAKSGIGAVRSVKNTATAAKASTAAAKETTKQATIAAEQEAARRAAEAAAAEAAPAALVLPPVPQL